MLPFSELFHAPTEVFPIHQLSVFVHAFPAVSIAQQWYPHWWSAFHLAPLANTPDVTILVSTIPIVSTPNAIVKADALTPVSVVPVSNAHVLAAPILAAPFLVVLLQNVPVSVVPVLVAPVIVAPVLFAPVKAVPAVLVVPVFVDPVLFVRVLAILNVALIQNGAVLNVFVLV